jgi:uncharacterized repeat protein (TIGR01451 family)
VDLDNPVAAGVVQISNTADIGDDGSNGADQNTADNSDTDTTPVNAVPDLQLSKDDGGVTAVPGDTIAYTLAYTNTGNQGATNVTLTETVPANTTFNAGASTAGWTCPNGAPAGSACTINVGSLAGSGASGSAVFAVNVDNPVAAGVTQIDNEAGALDDGTNGADPNQGDNVDTDSTPITAAPDLSISKDDGGAVARAGETVVYTLVYSNAGNQAATGVTITDTVPTDTTFNPGASTAGWACSPDNTAGSICTLAVGALAGGGAGGSVTFAVDVDDPYTGGPTVTNTASIGDDGANGADQNPADNSDSDSTPIDGPVDISSISINPATINENELAV